MHGCRYTHRTVSEERVECYLSILSGNAVHSAMMIANS